MMIEVKTQNSVAVIKLNNGVTNALNLELIIELGNTLKRLKSDPDVSGLVLGSTNDKFFSIGFDIPKLIDLSRKDFQTFYRSFNQTCLNLYTIPKPTLASITGHAVAGGCIITLCCDYRFIAEGRKLMGLNEIKLGVPVPYLADCITRTLLGEKTARDVMETGEFYSTEKLMQTGMVDEVIPTEELEKEGESFTFYLVLIMV